MSKNDPISLHLVHFGCDILFALAQKSCLFIFMSGISAQFSPAPSDPDLNACNHVEVPCGPGTNFPYTTSYFCDNVNSVWWAQAYGLGTFYLIQGICNTRWG
jgi:hypothetical protein